MKPLSSSSGAPDRRTLQSRCPSGSARWSCTSWTAPGTRTRRSKTSCIQGMTCSSPWSGSIITLLSLAIGNPYLKPHGIYTSREAKWRVVVEWSSVVAAHVRCLSVDHCRARESWGLPRLLEMPWMEIDGSITWLDVDITQLVESWVGESGTLLG